MKLKELSPDTLHDSRERTIAKLARIARCDTVFGGAKALVLLRRLQRSPNHGDYSAAVCEVYSRSDGTVCGHGAYECPECGSAHFGTEAALLCCNDGNE